MRPVVDVIGTTVVVTQGGQETRIPCQSNDAAWEHAAELEAEHVETERRISEQIARYEERGVDVVQRHPEDPAAGADVAPASPVSAPVRPPITVSGANVTFEGNSFVEAAMPAPVEVSHDTPDEDDSDDQPTGPDDNGPDVTASVRWEDESSRLVLTVSTDSQVDLWRSMGGRTSTFSLEAGQESTRAFKGQRGDDFALRVGDADGPLVLEHTVPAEITDTDGDA